MFINVQNSGTACRLSLKLTGCVMNFTHWFNLESAKDNSLAANEIRMHRKKNALNPK